MKILLVEDNYERIEFFKDIIPVLDIAKDAVTGIEFLKKNKYDLLFLDHDLGNRIYVQSDDPDTGYQVAKFIKENNIDIRVIVHSHNMGGAQNIKSLLPESELIPFGYFTCKCKVENDEIVDIEIVKSAAFISDFGSKENNQND